MIAMNMRTLIDTTRSLFAGDKGLLAMDESTSTCNQRFAQYGIPQTAETRRAYRELLITTPGLNEGISGVILYDETLHQKTSNGVNFLQVLGELGIIPGIKVDLGTQALAGHSGETITAGLDDLRERLAKYAQMGLRFAKWRSVMVLGPGLPSRACISANAHALARYAALCQEAGLVPIIEPELKMDGLHSLEDCRESTEEILHRVFKQLYNQGVCLEGILLKPNMVLPGLGYLEQENSEQIADATVQTLLRTVPAAVPGIAFLSGGQTAELATARLSLMNLKFKSQMPWGLSFSFSRALQLPALAIWQGQTGHALAAQQVLYHRVRCNQAARRGEYTAAMENGNDY
jgi:fructose-bisphosphate aldolase, class I